MNTPLLCLKVRGKRDLVLARQRARQLAGLLGFGPEDQACIAAAVFALACHAAGQARRASLSFQVSGDSLEVSAGADAKASGEVAAGLGSQHTAIRLAKPLPKNDKAMSPDDAAWSIQELHRRTPLNVFDEIQRQNQELLQALHDLQAPQSRRAAGKSLAA